MGSRTCPAAVADYAALERPAAISRGTTGHVNRAVSRIVGFFVLRIGDLGLSLDSRLSCCPGPQAGVDVDRVDP